MDLPLEIIENINDIFYEHQNYDNCVKLPKEIITKILVILEEHERYENKIRHQERYLKVMRELTYYSSLPDIYMFDTPMSFFELESEL